MRCLIILLTITSGFFPEDAHAQSEPRHKTTAVYGTIAGGSPALDPFLGPAPGERHKPTTVDRWLAAAGAIGGSWGLGVSVYAVLDRYASDNRIEGDYFFSPTANAGLVLSSSVGAALGFSGVLRARDAEFNFTRVLVGTTVASLPFLLGIDGPFLPYYALTLGTTLQVAGALVGISRYHAWD